MFPYKGAVRSTKNRESKSFQKEDKKVDTEKMRGVWRGGGRDSGSVVAGFHYLFASLGVVQL